MKKQIKDTVVQLLQQGGISVNGSQPWDIQVHNEDFYPRLWLKGALGAGESYMDGWWDCERLDMFTDRILRAKLDTKTQYSWVRHLKNMAYMLINLQTKSGARVVGKKHYDLGNSLFEAMLDSELNYSCGYWREAKTLDQAQLAKMDLCCRKLQLQPGMRLLDIGCGWGALAKYAAKNYGVEVVGVTISEKQHQYAVESCKNLPVKVLLQDYRDINEKFDRIVSVGMFEHVGPLNYRTYMETAHQCLKEDGMFLLHTIGNNEMHCPTNEWTRKYIFPRGVLPSMDQIAIAADKLFIVEDWHNFGADYDHTLMAWDANFNHHWQTLKAQYDERFYRMWNFYLLTAAGGFRARAMQLWQILFTKHGIIGGYIAPR